MSWHTRHSLHSYGPRDFHVPSKFVQALVDHTSNLEVFEFYRDEWHARHSIDTFGSFEHLLKLHTLRIDVNRLIDHSSKVPAQVTGPRQLLPDSLRQLHLTEMPRARLNQYYNQSLRTERTVSRVAMDFVTNVARNLPLGFLSIEVNEIVCRYTGSTCEDHLELNDEALQHLQHLVNDGVNATKDMRIHAAAGKGKTDEPVYLVGPGHVFHEWVAQEL